MINPFRSRTNHSGNIIIESQHFAQKKLNHSLDKLESQNIWCCEHELNPISSIIINSNCTCIDYQIKSTKIEKYQCKHIIEDLGIIGIIL